MRRVWAVALIAAACGGEAQQPEASSRVRSSDPDLVELAETLLPDLARRSGMELNDPVRIERRTRAELVRYLETKLDEELPVDEARNTVAAYALMGLVPDSLDLRAVLLGLYTEQVAGFYEPDSTALFILDDQPPAALHGLLVHELVHAVQDQTVDLAALTDPGLGNDRATAARSAAEGHATLVMFEYMTEQMSGRPVDLADVEDFGAVIRPALEGMRSYPALASAPPVIRETLLFPYLEGASFVQRLWASGERVPPFGAYLPASTEQVLTGDLGDEPEALRLSVDGVEVLHEDGLGALEVGILANTHAGDAGRGLEAGWEGDRYLLLESGEGRGLVLVIAWDRSETRDRFVDVMGHALARDPDGATVEAVESPAGPAVLLRFGRGAQGAAVHVGIAPR